MCLDVDYVPDGRCRGQWLVVPVLKGMGYGFMTPYFVVRPVNGWLFAGLIGEPFSARRDITNQGVHSFLVRPPTSPGGWPLVRNKFSITALHMAYAIDVFAMSGDGEAASSALYIPGLDDSHGREKLEARMKVLSQRPSVAMRDVLALHPKLAPIADVENWA